MSKRQGLWIDRDTFVEFSEAETTSLSKEIATRDRSPDFYSLGMALPNPDIVLRKLGKSIEVYSNLLTDAHVGSCVISRKAGVKSLKWSIDRGKAKSRQAKLIEDTFKALDMNRILGEILNAPLFGYQPMEILWQKVGSWILPRDIVGKPQRWFQFDEQNQPRFMTKQDTILGETLPERKFFIPRHEPTYENPYGFALLSRCFWPVTFKKGGYKFWVTFCEKYGMPFLLGKLPRGLGNEEYQALYSILEKMVQDAVAVIPDDGSIEMVTSKGSGSGSSDLYEKLLTYGDNEVSKALLGQTLTTQVGDTGSYAASKTHMQVRDDIVWEDKLLCEQTMNQVIRWIDELNFNSGNPPTFSLYEEEDVDSALAERDDKLSTSMEKSGLKLSRQYYQRSYGLEEGDIEASTDGSNSSNRLTGSTGVQFAEAGDAENLAPDQAALDAAIETISPEDLQKQMEGVLKPVIDLINGGTDFNSILDTLAEAYPNMDSSALEEMLTRAIFVSELWGRINAKG